MSKQITHIVIINHSGREERKKRGAKKWKRKGRKGKRSKEKGNGQSRNNKQGSLLKQGCNFIA